MSYEAILNLMNVPCRHSNSYTRIGYGALMGRDAACTQICKQVDDIITEENDEIPSEQFVSSFISYMYTGQKHSSYVSYKNCLQSENATMIYNTMTNLLILQNPTLNGMKLLVSQKLLSMLEIISDKQTTLNFTDYNTLLKLCLSDNDKILTVVQKMLQKTDYSKAMELYVTSSSYLKCIDTLLNDEYVPNQIEFELLHKLAPSTNEYIIKFLTYGVFYNTVCLENACLSGSAECIKKILDARISPTQKCFANVISSSIFPRENLVEMLVYYNYVITYEDVILAIKKTFEIKDLSRFNITLDTNALELCYAYNFHPKSYNFEGVNASLRILQDAATKGNNVTEIKKIIKQYGLTPDYITMENACNFSRNKPVIMELVNAGGILTPKCICNCGSQLSRSETLVYIASEYAKQDTKNKEKICELENKIKELQESQENAEQNLLITNEGDENDNNDNNDNNENDNNDNNENDNNEDNDDVIKILKLTVPKNIKIPTSKRNKVNPPNSLVKFFALDKKVKMSYIEVRKYLRNMIQEKNWVSKDNKILIDFPEGFRKIIGIEKNGFIHHSDLDTIVSLCYK